MTVTCRACEGRPPELRCPEHSGRWVRIEAHQLPAHKGSRVALSESDANDSDLVPDRLLYAVINGTGVDIATRDGRCTLTPIDHPVWIQPDPYPTIPTEVGDQFILPI